MALEIERKFAVTIEDFKKLAGQYRAARIDQGYLVLAEGFHSRVRIQTDLESKEVICATFTSKLGSGMVREEHEDSVSISHARILLKRSLKVVHKQRLEVKYKGLTWEVDYFVDHDLAVAEVELPSVDHKFEKPDWAGKEVTKDKKYSNIRLAKDQKANE